MTADVDTTKRLGAAPRVNLLPAWVAERRLVRRQRLGVVAGFAALLCLLALLWLAESARVDRARQAAADQRAATAQLEAERAGLQPWADLQARVVAAEQLRAKAYAREVRFSGVLQDVAMLMPDNAWLNQFTATLNDTQQAGATTAATTPKGGSAAEAVPGAPGFGEPIGTITFSGQALGHVDVGRVVRVLDGAVKRNGGSVYMNPYYTSSQKQAQGAQTAVTFLASVDLGPAALSGRFQRPGGAGGR